MYDYYLYYYQINQIIFNVNMLHAYIWVFQVPLAVRRMCVMYVPTRVPHIDNRCPNLSVYHYSSIVSYWNGNQSYILTILLKWGFIDSARYLFILIPPAIDSGELFYLLIPPANNFGLCWFHCLYLFLINIIILCTFWLLSILKLQ